MLEKERNDNAKASANFRIQLERRDQEIKTNMNNIKQQGVKIRKAEHEKV